MFYKTNKLERWVEEYITEKSKRYPIAANQHSDWLYMFMEVCNKEIVDISIEDKTTFQRYIDERYYSRYHRDAANKAVGCFIRFYRSRGHSYLPNFTAAK